MTIDEAMQSILSHLNVANQINDRLNAMRRRLRINTTQMLLLAELSPAAQGHARPASASELAARLQQSRSMVSIQLKGLTEDGLIEGIEPEPDEDRRSRRFRVTSSGAKKADEIMKQLVQLATVLRVLLGHELAPAYIRSVRQLAEELPAAPALTHAHTAFNFRQEVIRKRRTATLAHTKTKEGSKGR